jgi:hypothetical protein
MFYNTSMNTPKSKKLQLVPIIFCCVKKENEMAEDTLHTSPRLRRTGKPCHVIRHGKNSNQEAFLLESKLQLVLMIVRGFNTY